MKYFYEIFSEKIIRLYVRKATLLFLLILFYRGNIHNKMKLFFLARVDIFSVINEIHSYEFLSLLW